MRNFKNFILLGGISAVVALTGLTGCQSWGNKGDGERSAGRVADDKKITAEVEKRLKSEPVYKFDQVDVNTFEGVVQLSGFVNTEEQKRRAEEIAQRVEGVAQVVDHMSLKPQVTPTGRIDPNNPPPR